MKSRSAKHQTHFFSSQSSVSDFFTLLKPRVMALAIFTSVCGLLLSPINMHPFFFVLSIFCISLGAGASGAINMWYDRDIDALMDRTKKRPIPMGRIDAYDALGFGIVLSIVSIVIGFIFYQLSSAIFYIMGLSLIYMLCNSYFNLHQKSQRYAGSLFLISGIIFLISNKSYRMLK